MDKFCVIRNTNDKHDRVTVNGFPRAPHAPGFFPIDAGAKGVSLLLPLHPYGMRAWKKDKRYPHGFSLWLYEKNVDI